MTARSAGGRAAAAVVASAALDVRRAPDHRSEMRSQLLTGEVVRRLASTAGGAWWRVRNTADGYEGWVRSWGLVPASSRRAAVWRERATLRVAAPIVELTARPGGGAAVGPLFLNARVIPGRRAGRAIEVELPDGRRGYGPRHAFAAEGRRRDGLERRVRSLLGAPYLWGGRTPAGYDCSGYVQQVLAEHGVALPRDAWQQARACRPLRADERAGPGDLIFFGPPRGRISHVGLALGGDWFTDCRGRVRLVSADPGNPLCDKELIAQIRGRGRPGRTPG